MSLPKQASKIFDNINQKLVDALLKTLENAHRADFCIGFFRLSGWGQVAAAVDHFAGGDATCCRVLIGMSESLDQELRRWRRQVRQGTETLDLARAAQLKARIARTFRQQLVGMAPTNSDEVALRTLCQQIQAGKVQVRLHLRYELHAKLYLAFRDDPDNPVTAYLGSSNLTMSGLRAQGELNTKLTDALDTEKLAAWFDARWHDEHAYPIADALVAALTESWAGVERRPYHIYLKMAYHVAEEARAGLHAFSLPPDFRGKLFPFQEAAVKIAARHLNERGGVLLGDVVGLGKTMLASALVRIFRDDFNLRPVIVCPKNVVPMWAQYNETWDLHARIIPFSMAHKEFPHLPARYKLIVIDESHTLRNPEGQRYKAIADYVHAFGEKECKVILLSATPYNTSYLDLSAQLRLFLPDDRDLGVRPEVYLRAGGDAELLRAQVSPRTLRAFTFSPHADDWRELMRRFMVRRTRSFIKQHYATFDAPRQRYYLELPDHARFYFPDRVPRTVPVATTDAHDPYRTLYDTPVVEAIGTLTLPRYGLANYLKANARQLAAPAEAPLLDNLSRAGKRLMGFCRTNLFKRLESNGAVFLQSLDRHVLRNAIVLHALTKGLPIPIGAQTADLLGQDSDEDADGAAVQEGSSEEETTHTAALAPAVGLAPSSAEAYQRRAEQLYTETAGALDDEDDQEVDLASYAYQIWRNATTDNPGLKKIIEDMPSVVYSARHRDDPTAVVKSLPFQAPKGVLVYLKAPDGTDTLTWLDTHGTSVTQSQDAILRAAECTLATAPAPRADNHHDLVHTALALVEQREALGGALGSPRGARYRLYEKLTAYRDDLVAKEPLLLSAELERTIDDIYRYPLRQAAADTLNRQLRSGASAEQLADLAKALRDENNLCFIQDSADDAPDEPQVVCSLGLV